MGQMTGFASGLRPTSLKRKPTGYAQEPAWSPTPLSLKNAFSTSHVYSTCQANKAWRLANITSHRQKMAIPREFPPANPPVSYVFRGKLLLDLRKSPI